MLRDVRYAIRALRLNPGFALTAIISIALAIGANSAIFAMADGVMLRPLAVPNPSQILSLRSRAPDGHLASISYADFADIRDRNRSFENLIAYTFAPAGLAKDAANQPQYKMGLLVSGNFFSALHVEPQFGRGFTPEEDQAPGRDPVVVISNDLWKTEFGADASVLNRKIRLNDLEFTVIGITGESFTGIEHMLRPAFYVPAMMGPKLLPNREQLLTDRKQRGFFLKGRVKPGVSTQAAQADITAIVRSLEEAYPETNRAFGAAVLTERQERIDFDPFDAPLLEMLSALSIVVLAIACANVANLMLSRGRSRAREIAISMAIGANRRRLIRQLLAESLTISIVGGAAGLLIAEYAVDVFSTIQIPSDVPLQFTFRLDYRVAVFTLLVSIASAIFFGLVPALQSTKTDLVTTLKAGESDDVRKRFFGRRALVVVQVAGSLVLLVTGAEMYHGMTTSLTANPGFRIDHRLTMRFAPAASGYSPDQTMRFYKTLLDSSRNQAGVQSAALSSWVPLTADIQTEVVFPEGQQFPAGHVGDEVLTSFISDRYFETFGVPIVAGRGFTESDRADSPLVAVVNEQFARRYFGGNPIGKRIRTSPEGKWIEIVGMTPTGKYTTVFEGPAGYLYLPYTQVPPTRMTLIAETRGDPAAMAQPIREIVHSLDASVPLAGVRTMDDLFNQRSVKVADILLGVVGTLSAIGLVLAVVGLYALVSYQVSRKTREIGIRMALGAEREHVVKSVLGQAASMVASGVAVGIALIVAATRAAGAGGDQFGGGFLVVTPNLAWATAVTLGLILTALAAAAIPAWRAARIDPMQALRQD
jgi:predicted permease